MASEHHEAAASEVGADETHENSWSADLEGPQYAGDRERTIADAKRAIRRTAGGYHVNLVTHAENGHPEAYLFAVLDDLGVDYEYVRQCGCGGYVTRVHL